VTRNVFDVSVKPLVTPSPPPLSTEEGSGFNLSQEVHIY
jgi:hypothetical protein